MVATTHPKHETPITGIPVRSRACLGRAISRLMDSLRLIFFNLTPSSQELGHPATPGRFTLLRRKKDAAFTAIVNAKSP
jgi:hypothetical protein